MNSQRDPHDVLGVRRGASRVEIRAAYRRLARKVHPDVDDGRHSDEMAALNEAYRTLTSEPQRAQGTTQARPHADHAAPTPPPAVVSRPVSFPWRGVVITSAVGAAAIVVLSLFAGPEVDSPPDGVIQSGSCVVINEALFAVEVPCDQADSEVVKQLVPLDAVCADGAPGFLDQLGMGRVCLE
ncbi:MAG: J domain-containing protein [Ilumatobacteraceae bacterium]